MLNFFLFTNYRVTVYIYNIMYNILFGIKQNTGKKNSLLCVNDKHENHEKQQNRNINTKKNSV